MHIYEMLTKEHCNLQRSYFVPDNCYNKFAYMYRIVKMYFTLFPICVGDPVTTTWCVLGEAVPRNGGYLRIY